jgi:titin
VTATPGSAHISISWTAPSFDGGAPIQGYKVYWSSEQDGPFSSVLVATTSYLHEGLTSGITYYYKVAAISSVGEGESSGVVSATTASPSSLPSAILDLASKVRNSMVELSWSAPASDGGSPITGYMVYRGTSANDMVNIATVAETSFVDTSAQVGIEYVYGVYAVNGNGMGTSAGLVEAVVTNETTASSSVPLEYLAVIGVGLAAVVAGMAALLSRWKARR